MPFRIIVYMPCIFVEKTQYIILSWACYYVILIEASTLYFVRVV